MNRLFPRMLPLPLVVFLLGGPAAPAYVPLPDKPKKENSNALLKKHKDKVVATASSSYGGYAVTNLLDGNPDTTWFSASNDSVGRGTTPWVELQLPQDEVVTRVHVMGNRDPSYPAGYSVLEGRLELLDKDRKVLWTGDVKGAGDKYDFEFKTQGTKGVRYIKFTSTKDEGASNGSGDVALSDILAE